MYTNSDGDGITQQLMATEHSNLTAINDSPHKYTLSDFIGTQEYYIVVYTILIVLSMILTPLRSILFYKIFMNASKGLHKKMFSNVLAAPMRFFDTNPSGKSIISGQMEISRLLIC